MTETSQVASSNDDKSHGVDMCLCGTIEVELKVTSIEKAKGLSTL